jgi:hypothetical protein
MGILITFNPKPFVKLVALTVVGDPVIFFPIIAKALNI